jgi:hypothetical protein
MFLLCLHTPAEDLLKVMFYGTGCCSVYSLTRSSSAAATAVFMNADIHKIKDSLQQLTQIVLTMCKQQNINISNADIVGLAPNTPSGLSPLGSFCHLSLGRGSRGSSVHSGGRSCNGLLTVCLTWTIEVACNT